MDMDLLVVPDSLSTLIDQSPDIDAALVEFISSTSEVLADNKLFFFPDFTDHGIRHVQHVLDDSLRLLTPEATANLTSGDAFLIVASVILHDLGMHLSVSGFRELIQRRNSNLPSLRFWPDKEFVETTEWGVLWKNFVLEARKWNDESNQIVFGKNVPAITLQSWNQLEKTSVDSDRFPAINEDSQRLIGEFIRRHHARLAHEIAVLGYPGNSSIPVLFKKVSHLGDLAGFVARSHHLSIRACADFLRNKLGGSKRGPSETNYVLAMGLLRISDYIQIDFARASTVLFNMRRPISPVSVREWQKHQVLSRPSFASPEEKRIHFDVREQPSYPTFLALNKLLANIQQELDQTNGALAEYSNCDSFRWSRITCDLFEKSFTNTLPFVARESEVTVDPRIVSLLVSPIYDDEPSYGIRELLQNSLDAVHQFHHYSSKNRAIRSSVEFEEIEGDIELRLIQGAGREWEFVITDNGIGMSDVTIREHFLKVGSSYRDSEEFQEQFVSGRKKAAVVRSGRFGVGVFSAFMLGHDLLVRTRHVDAAAGYEFKVSFQTGFSSQEPVELVKQDSARHGTQIRIRMARDIVQKLGVRFLGHSDEVEAVDSIGDKWDWYVGDFPKVTRIVELKCGTEFKIPGKQMGVQDPSKNLRCFTVPSSEVSGFNWTIDNHPKVGLDVNGIVIGKPANFGSGRFGMSLTRLQVEFGDDYPLLVPPISVEDRDNAVPMSLKRDQTIRGGLPKTTKKLADELVLNWIGFCMACAPSGNSVEQEIILDPSSEFFQSYPFLKQTLPFIHEGNTLNDIDVMQCNWMLAQGAIHIFTPAIVSEVPFSRLVYAGFAFSGDHRVSTLPLCRFQVPNTAEIAYAFEGGRRLGHGHDRGVNLLPSLARLAYAGEQRALPNLGGISGVRIMVGLTRDKFDSMLRSHGMTEYRFEGQTHDGGLNIFGFGESPVLSDYEQHWASQFASVPAQYLEIICPYIGVIELSDRCVSGSENKLSQKWKEVIGSKGIPFLEAERRDWAVSIIDDHPSLESHYNAWEDYKNEWRLTHTSSPKS